MTARRGEIWRVSLDPIVGHEQGRDRPALIVSDDRLDQSAAGLVIVVPLTTRERGIPSHVEISPPQGGLRTASFAMCEQVRSVSVDRLRGDPWGQRVAPLTMAAVEQRLRFLLRL